MQIIINETDIKESYRVNKQEDSMILVKLEKNEKKEKFIEELEN